MNQNDDADRDQELEQILSSLVDGTLTKAQQTRLEQELRNDARFRQRYTRYLEVEALLHYRAGRPTDDPQEWLKPLENKDASVSKAGADNMPVVFKSDPVAYRIRRTALGLVVVVACLLAVIVVITPKDPTVVERINSTSPFSLVGARIDPLDVVDVQRLSDNSIRLREGTLLVSTRRSKASPSGSGRVSRQLKIRTLGGIVTPLKAGQFVVQARNSNLLLKRRRFKPRVSLLVLAGAAAISSDSGSESADGGEVLIGRAGENPKKLVEEGNYRESLELLEKAITNGSYGGKHCVRDVRHAVLCLSKLGRYAWFDELMEKVVASHPNDWQVLHAVGQAYVAAPKQGVIISERFVRTGTGGRPTNVIERDRIRSLQLFLSAKAIVPEGEIEGRDTLLGDLQSSLMLNRQWWNLQVLTDTSRLPDFDVPVYFASSAAPPVTDDGSPVFYSAAAGWDSAENDGQRWRWLMEERIRLTPNKRLNRVFELAQQLHSQFGVHTSGVIDSYQLEDGELPTEGRHTTHTLANEETIARLATGIKRFELPEDQQFIRMLEEVASAPFDDDEAPLTDVGYAAYVGAWEKLPDFPAKAVDAIGEVPSNLFDLAVAPRDDHFGLMFSGILHIAEAGEYEFEVQSDDGSRLYVEGQLVVDHDGWHGMDAKRGVIKLKPGFQRVRLDYFQHERGDGLIVSYRKVGGRRRYLSKQRPSTVQLQAAEMLARIYENRRQLVRAAKAWEQCIDRFGTGSRRWRRYQLEQLVGNWGRVESGQVLAAGKPATIDFEFRNARSVKFRARRVKLEAYLDWMKQDLKSDPKNVDWRHRLFAVGRAIVQEDQDRYLEGDEVSWTISLDPAPNHWSRRIRVETPLLEPGLYLVEGQIENGNWTRTVCWVTDTMVVMKPANKGQLYLVVDASSGEPISKANVEVFGFWTNVDRSSGRRTTRTVNLSKFTDANGIAKTDQTDVDDDRFARVVIARDEANGRLGVLGDFFREAPRELDLTLSGATRVWCTTDRPVYRPNQVVFIKGWVRRAQFDLMDVSLFGGRRFWLKVHDASGSEILKKQVTADEFGGVDVELALEADAKLGRYAVSLFETDDDEDRGLGGVSFRVEEYKRPEYEVSVTGPDEAIQLGEKARITVQADYYFGEPVRSGRVKYRVTRQRTADTWFPAARWDWCYGAGYWWWGYDYKWYPGFAKWSLMPPGWFAGEEPELIEEKTVLIGADGSVNIVIDSSEALTRFEDTDHRYNVTAEVTDESGRTVKGAGSVVAARQPFRVFVWADRGHYRVGETLSTSIQARTPNGAIGGELQATLFRTEFDSDGKPVEEAIQTASEQLDDEGRQQVSFETVREGLYRIECRVTSDQGETAIGAALTRVLGEDLRPAEGDTAFNDLEIVLDKPSYAPGEAAKVMIASKHKNATVQLFVRARDGVYPEPTTVKLDGHVHVQAIDVTPADMPNIHLEAVTVVDGRVVHANKELIVPPERRILNVEIVPEKSRWNPGETASLALRLTDLKGNPFQGSTTISVYDRSLESIAASEVPRLADRFWRWRRNHRLRYRATADNPFGQLLRHGEREMVGIGYHFNQWHQWGGYWDYGRGGAMYANKAFYLGKAIRATPYSFFATRATRDFGLEGMEVRFAAPAGFERAEEAAPDVRKNFAETAYWSAHVTTNAAGEAAIDVELPDSLTSWKVKVWAMGHGTRVGQGETELITSKDLIVRLQTPRFLTQGDQVVLSANVHNYTARASQLVVQLDVDEDRLKLAPNVGPSATIQVGRNEDQRVVWTATAMRTGATPITVTARSEDGGGDAMQRTLPIQINGIQKSEPMSVVLASDEASQKISLQIPTAVIADKTSLDLRVSPSIALSIVDALPYLIANADKNSETLTSRLYPLATSRRMLNHLGVDLEKVRANRNNLNSGESGDPDVRRRQWNRQGLLTQVLDDKAFAKSLETTLRDLNSLQNSDGGWGWYAGHSSTPHATAYVVQGLITARDNGAAIVPRVIDRGIEWLANFQERQLKSLRLAADGYHSTKANVDDVDVYVLNVLSLVDKCDPSLVEFAHRDRLDLSKYGLALLGMVQHRIGEPAKRDAVIRNLDQFVVSDDENQTSYLRLPGRRWWAWYGNGIEANAALLKLLCLAGDGKGDLASGLAKYLVNQRKHASYWSGTRDTALVVDALCDFVVASGEASVKMSVEVLVDGRQVKKTQITAANLFTFDNRLLVGSDLLTPGKHELEIVKTGDGRLYVSGELSYFSVEDAIEPAGLDVRIARKYYRLVSQDESIDAANSRGQLIDYRIRREKRVPLEDGQPIEAGDHIEVELLVDAKNDYSYVSIVDRKPAGLEALDIHSGHRWLGGVSAYMQLRDARTEFLVQRLRRGRHRIAYRLRAETAGEFRSLPASALGVYAPELKANSGDRKITVVATSAEE